MNILLFHGCWISQLLFQHSQFQKLRLSTYRSIVSYSLSILLFGGSYKLDRLLKGNVPSQKVGYLTFPLINNNE